MARKEKQYHFIYKTTNLLSGKYYYGMHSTNNLNDGYYGSGRRLRRSLNKHGKENHVVEYIEFLPDRITLCNREKEIVNLNEIAKENCMNLMIGGQGGYVSDTASKLGWQKMDEILFNKYGLNCHSIVSKNYYDSLTTEELLLHKKKISEGLKNAEFNCKTFLGKNHSVSTINKMRKNKNIGNKNSQFGTCWITNGCDNTKINRNDKLPINWKYGRTLK
jgi:hypothetical protein